MVRRAKGAGIVAAAIDLVHHTRRTIATVPTVPGPSGLDSIQAAPGGDTYLPGSENGDLYLLRPCL